MSAVEASPTPSGGSPVTKYNDQGFLVTIYVPAGASTGWDDRGLPTTWLAGARATPVALAAELKAVTGTQTGLATLTTDNGSNFVTASVTHSGATKAVPGPWTPFQLVVLGILSFSITFCLGLGV